MAFRSTLKSGLTSFINLFGLAIGIGCSLLIFIYVNHEISYDQFHTKADRIFRVLSIDEALGVSNSMVGITMPGVGAAIKTQLPEVENTVRMQQVGQALLTYEDNSFYTENTLRAEHSFFEIFDYELKTGDRTTVLSAPYKAVMTESMAAKTFGTDTDAIGKTFTLNNQQEYEITGILKDQDKPSHLQFDLIYSMYPAQSDSGLVQYLSSFNNISMTTYALLKDPAMETSVEEKIEPILRENEVPDMWKVTLQPLKDTHLNASHVIFDRINQNKGDASYIYSLSAIAIFVLLIAAFNFMNLATARSTKRAREVSMRKVMGAGKNQLILQHLGESIFMAFSALVVALILVAITNSFVTLPISEAPLIYLFTNPISLTGILGGTLLLGILSGLYPAFMLSSFEPIRVLKGNFTTSSKGVFLRRVLVILQFAVSIAMIAGTAIVYKQLNYIKNKNLGFNKEQVLNIPLNNQQLAESAEQLKNTFSQLPGVSGVASASSLPGQGFGRTGIRPEGVGQEEDPWIVSIMTFDEDFIEMLGMEIVTGRNFSAEFGTEQDKAVIINEALVNELGWDEAIGKKLFMGENERTIVGVVKDFHFASMRHKIEPIIMLYQPNANGTVAVRLKLENMGQTIALIDDTWEEINTGMPFEYTFFDEDFGQLFQSEEAFSDLIVNFTWLAIFIACLGLFGLASFIAEQKTKEIGIRKVLGSSVSRIVAMLSKEFAILVIIANGIAWPIAWYAMENWLQDFEYRTVIHLSTFLLAGVISLAIALLTVSYHSIKAAIANPVKSLRDD
ncbi:MAG: ABC transporter permease [Bacteroidota bacterium]